MQSQLTSRGKFVCSQGLFLDCWSHGLCSINCPSAYCKTINLGVIVIRMIFDSNVIHADMLLLQPAVEHARNYKHYTLMAMH
jgi:hypothetical protein